MLRRSYDNVRVHFTNVASGKVTEAIKEAQNDGLEVRKNYKFYISEVKEKKFSVRFIYF